jgi:hypothetical protein
MSGCAPGFLESTVRVVQLYKNRADLTINSSENFFAPFLPSTTSLHLITMSEVFPSHILAWQKSFDVVRMEEVPAGDSRRTVQGFEVDPLFHGPAPHFDFNDPYEQDEDRLKKVSLIFSPSGSVLIPIQVTRYWAARDLERSQRARRYDELLKAESEATERDMAGPSGKGKEAPKTPRRTPRKVSGHSYFRSALTDSLL